MSTDLEDVIDAVEHERLQEAARDHLWLHFSRHSVYEGGDMPVIVRGEGAYIYDSHGRRYLDGLAGLFVNQLGHGRTELAEAAAKQAATLAFHPLWSYAHPGAIELAEKIAGYAPGDLNRVFFTTGGGEAVESAWKLAKHYFKLTGKPTKHKVISRAIAYHGTPQGALSITGIPGMKAPFEPLVPSTFRVPEHQLLPRSRARRRPRGLRPLGGRPDRRGHRVRGPRHRRRGVPRAGAELRWLLPAAARLLPAGPRDLRRVRRAAGHRRGHLRVRPARPHVRRRALRLPARHHHLRQGPHLRLRPARRDDRQRPADGAVPAGAQLVPARLHLRRPPGLDRGGAEEPRDLRGGEDQRARARPTRARSARPWRGCTDLPIVGDVRGDGYFYGIELVKDKATKETFDDDESERLLRGFLSKALYDAGLYCRADDRGDPVIQLAPPLICDQQHFDEMEQILRAVLDKAWTLL